MSEKLFIFLICAELFKIILHLLFIYNVKREWIELNFKLMITTNFYLCKLLLTILLIFHSCAFLLRHKDLSSISLLILALSLLHSLIVSTGLIFTEEFALIKGEKIPYAAIKHIHIKEDVFFQSRNSLKIAFDASIGSIKISIKKGYLKQLLSSLKANESMVTYDM
ncbi:hypothetical protein [Desnuesiella massiliensis]|uniref:hypothetical protein n=1 Tax=Desnuesiella massiliensis TaxID=1650662 RepID=UPI0006E18F8B|nr:hypothetical protein [Desnuesiella massiliensis]